MTDATNQPDAAVLEALARMDLLRPDETATFTPLTGGVASDIWKVDAPGRSFCVKRALAKLRVKDDWRVTVERNAFEVGWIETVRGIVPEAAPAMLGADSRTNLFAMRWLPPEEYPVWKSMLMAGDIRNADAAAVGTAMATIHASSMNDPEIAARFRSDAIFRDIRLDAYLGATAKRHPDLAAQLDRLIETTAATKVALIHGDMSPKNILIGPMGPVFLDAECAWYGDPAFDLAFCLNHLLLKCLWRRENADAYLESFDVLAESYRKGIGQKYTDPIETRAARLLSGLLLARVDGKSPVEYLTNEADQYIVRKTARELLLNPVECLSEVRGHWRKGLAS